MSSDATYLATLRTTRQQIVTDGLKSASENLQALGFMDLKSLTDEIERVEMKINRSSGNRKIWHGVKRVNL